MLRHQNASVLSTAALAAASVLALTLGGCYSTETNLFSTTMGTFNYASTAMRPVTITIVDARTEEPIFKMDVPVGQQLSFHFDETGGDDPVLRPAKMSWSMWEAGNSFGSLTNTLSVPPASARRIEYSLRNGPEYAPEAPQAAMRADEAATKPEWATEAGGPATTSNSKKLYN